MSQKKLDEISNLLLAYSAGEYHVKGLISDEVDELDMIISGINMLGEELQATNVSRDFFSGIFNSVSDYVFIVDEQGYLIDVNETAINTFNITLSDLRKYTFEDFIMTEDQGVFETIKRSLHSQNRFKTEVRLNQENRLIYGLCNCAVLHDRFDHFNGYLVNVKDITEEKERENLILRTVFATQQQEQRRVADDLHDSLGQELSMAQLMLANLSKYGTDEENFKKLLATCKEILQQSVSHLREICFDLMPSALIKGGLAEGVIQLVERLKKQDQIEVDLNLSENFPRLNADLEIAIYRIIQEFINNMIKHAEASKLNVSMSLNTNQFIAIELRDNGKGFNLAQQNNGSDSRGIQNMTTKVKAYGGQCELQSSPGKGTSLSITFPYLQEK